MNDLSRQGLGSLFEAALSNRDRVVSAQAAADQLGVCTRTLRRFREGGGGPAYCRIGTRVGYRLSDLDAFVAANTFRHAAEEATRRG